MTDEELDIYFIDILNRVIAELKDCADYVKELHTPEYDEINEDFDYSITQLTALLKEVHTIDDLAQQDDDLITDVFEYIQCYADNFIISNEPEQKEKDLAEYEKLEELLNLFLDTDDYDEYEEE